VEPQYAAIGAATLVACLLATAVTLPFIRAVTRPDALLGQPYFVT
jgi:hypothetical protein